ncbi:MAG: adenylate cyclase [Pseudomonadales bacterium]|nr:adenylate cyclase [Pseudomonadales bacterium]
MLKDDQFHYLIRATYQPRVAASALSVLITLSQYMSGGNIPPLLFVYIALVLLYPHLTYWISGTWFNSAQAAGVCMLFDGVVVGTMIVANGFYLFTSITFLAALVFSTAVIAKPKILLSSMALLLVVVTLGWFIKGPQGLGGSELIDGLCSLFLLLYSAMVAYQVFNVTARLRQSRELTKMDNQTLNGIMQHLRRYISPQVYAEIARRSEGANKTNRKRLTVFFSDIEGFTQLMDNLEEETVTHILNEYLNTMSEIAIKHGGTIDKFMGDGIMIFFGDPYTQGAKEDALACVRMSLEMGQNLKRLRRQWKAAGIYSDLHMRIGINTGYCAVGNFGSENRMDYTAVGSTVNLASRLEARAGRDAVLISNSTHQLVTDRIECHEQVPVKVKGLRQPIQNYLVLGEKSATAPSVIEKESSGFNISMVPSLVDIAKARELMLEIDSSLCSLERKQNESRATVRLLN